MSTADNENFHKSLSSDNDEKLSVIVTTDVEAHVSVKTVKATHTLYGRYFKWILFISLGLASYIFSLDITTTSAYLVYAVSEFGAHSLISPIQVAQSITMAVSQPIAAKIADASSRGAAFLSVLIFYVVGYIVIASAKSTSSVAGGVILHAVGYTGAELLTQVIVADVTTLKWRGLISSLLSTPLIVNAFIGSNISAAIVTHSGWRWGYGMFVTLIPATLSPLVLTLLWAENKARKLCVVPAQNTQVKKQPLLHRSKKLVEQLDVPGLFLIGTCMALILLPLTLTETAKGHWKNASMLSMFLIGIALIPIFAIWDFKFSKHPVIPPRFCFNRSVIIAALIGALDFVSFYLTLMYLYSFVIVVKPWSLINATYFFQTQIVALAVFAIAGGVAMRFLQRAKYTLIAGLGLRLLGVGLMIHSRGANGSDAELVLTQLLQGAGGGLSVVASRVSSQASVSHKDVAMVTAVVLLITQIGGAIGGAIAGAIWTNMMPTKLAQHLPFLSEEERRKLFGSIVAALAYKRGTPVREGVIQAYDDVMKTMAIVATVIAIVPLILAFFMPDWHLGDTQNAVEDIDLKEDRMVIENVH